MSDIESNRKPTRDYRSFSDGPWPFWDVLYARRSCRKYESMEPDREPVTGLERLVETACEVRGAPAGTLRVVSRPSTVERVRTGAYRGAVNKINLWLARAPVAAFLVMDVPAADVSAGRPEVLPRNVMAVEDAILWLTEQGLGTCWMAGVNQGEVKRAMGLSPEASVPAIISIGRPASTGRFSYSGVTMQVQSRRRKPLSRIAALERSDRAYDAGTIPRVPFSAVECDMASTVAMVGGGGTGCAASVELQVEACLEAARFAPSGANAQAWRFVVMRETGNLGRLAEACGRESAPGEFAIVASGSARAFASGLLDRPFWMIDVPIALSHMSLAAASMGCGVSVQTDDLDQAAVDRLAGLDRAMRTVGVVWVDPRS